MIFHGKQVNENLFYFLRKTTMTNNETIDEKAEKFIKQIKTLEEKHFHILWDSYDEVNEEDSNSKISLLRNRLFREINSTIKENDSFLSEGKELCINEKKFIASPWEKFWKFNQAELIEGHQRCWIFTDTVKLSNLKLMEIDYTITQVRSSKTHNFSIDVTSVKLDLQLGITEKEQIKQIIRHLNEEDKKNQQNNEEQKTPKITLNATQMVEQAKTKTLQQVQSNNMEENTVKKGRGR